VFFPWQTCETSLINLSVGSPRGLNNQGTRQRRIELQIARLIEALVWLQSRQNNLP
jgi:hypothetical protein